MERVRSLRKRSLFVVFAFCMAVLMAASSPIQAASSPTCSSLYDEVKKKCSTGAKKVSKKSSCTFLGYSYRKKVKDFYYATDSDQVYCVCIVKADSKSNAKKIKSQFDDIKKDNKSNKYLSSSEKKVVKAAQVGYSGCYAWYISLSSSSSTNKKAVKALKKKL